MDLGTGDGESSWKTFKVGKWLDTGKETVSFDYYILTLHSISATVGLLC